MMLAHVQFMFNHFWSVPFASRVMGEATSIAVSLPVLCELVWVWQRLIGFVMAVWLGDSCLACSCSGGSWPGPAGGWWRPRRWG